MTSETSIALCAIFVSLCALIVSIGQLAIQRRHNKLSVKPFLAGDCFRFQHSPFKFVLTNCGAGPAIIVGFSVYVGSNKLEFPSLIMLDNALESMGINNYLSIHTETKGGYIKPNTSLVLLEIDQQTANEVKSSFEKIRWEIKYNSIYGESSTLTVYTDEEA